MKITFYKYHGAGNDFILIDDRLTNFSLSSKQIKKICDRNIGIGSDGLILLKDHKKYDFEMIYFNCDGKKSSMCGNGGRCIVHFAFFLKIIKSSAFFLAADGTHKARILNDFKILLHMNDIDDIKNIQDYIYVNSGSPHHVIINPEIDIINVKKIGSKIRYSKMYNPQGVNVNFVQIQDSDEFKIRTYERGVENETLSCGSGAVASAIAMHRIGKTNQSKVKINTLGGLLVVCFKFTNIYTQITLEGPVKFVYKGEISL